jgi:hypothetical protein
MRPEIVLIERLHIKLGLMTEDDIAAEITRLETKLASLRARGKWLRPEEVEFSTLARRELSRRRDLNNAKRAEIAAVVMRKKEIEAKRQEAAHTAAGMSDADLDVEQPIGLRRAAENEKKKRKRKRTATARAGLKPRFAAMSDADLVEFSRAENVTVDEHTVAVAEIRKRIRPMLSAISRVDGRRKTRIMKPFAILMEPSCLRNNEISRRGKRQRR